MPYYGPDPDDWYATVGAVLGALVGIVTFIGCWIYCIATSGFLLGVGLGWLPSGIVAGIVAVATRFLWGFVALGVLWLIVAMNGSP